MLLASSVSCLFKWRQFEPEVILLAVGWYLRFSLSYRDVNEVQASLGHKPRAAGQLYLAPFPPFKAMSAFLS